MKNQLKLSGWVLCGLALNFGLARTAGAAAFSATGSLATERYFHTATLLLDGQVLAVGGIGNAGHLLSVEMYNPAKGTWTPTNGLSTARRYHSATLLPDGQVLVTGGQDSSYAETASSELYDPTAGQWASTGSLHSARYLHTATLLLNGKVLIVGGAASIGGVGTALNSAELYDPAKASWTSTGALAQGRYGHTATLLPSGKVLIAGGYDPNNGGDLTSAEIYDPSSGTWAGTGSLKSARDSHTATLLANGTVLVAGGFGTAGRLSAAEIYNPTNNAWTTTGSLTTARQLHTATLLPNGKVLVAGGDGTSGSLASAELYDFNAGSWSSAGNLVTDRDSHTATLLRSGKVLLAAGEDKNGALLKSAELYQSSSGVPGPIVLASGALLPDGSFRFGFTNSLGASFSVLAATNPSLPETSWTTLPGVRETLPGRYEFADPEAGNNSVRFYRVRSP